mgnify:CR=1 FL=1
MNNKTMTKELNDALEAYENRPRWPAPESPEMRARRAIAEKKRAITLHAFSNSVIEASGLVQKLGLQVHKVSWKIGESNIWISTMTPEKHPSVALKMIGSKRVRVKVKRSILDSCVPRWAANQVIPTLPPFDPEREEVEEMEDDTFEIATIEHKSPEHLRMVLATHMREQNLYCGTVHFPDGMVTTLSDQTRQLLRLPKSLNFENFLVSITVIPFLLLIIINHPDIKSSSAAEQILMSVAKPLSIAIPLFWILVLMLKYLVFRKIYNELRQSLPPLTPPYDEID